MSNSGLALSTSVICLNQTNDLDNNVCPVSDVVVSLSYHFHSIQLQYWPIARSCGFKIQGAYYMHTHYYTSAHTHYYNLHTRMDTFTHITQHAVMDTDTHNTIHITYTVQYTLHILLCIYIDILVMLYVCCVYRDRKFHIMKFIY